MRVTDFNSDKVSVIVPVYNRERYVEKSIKSAVALPQVGEVILIDDGSEDDSLSVCRHLEKMSDKIKVLVHENNANKGPAATRNLGIKYASYPLISFLDSDDIYHPNRFITALNILNSDVSVDGVYDAYSVRFQNGFEDVRGIRGSIPHENLFDELVKGKKGRIHTNAITLRKRVFERSGYFNEDLFLHQDVELWIRIAWHCRLVPGSLDEPVATVIRHDDNWMDNTSFSSKIKYYESSLNYFRNKKISITAYWLLWLKLVKFRYKNKSFVRFLSGLLLSDLSYLCFIVNKKIA